MIEKIRKIVTVQTTIFMILVAAFLAYYAKSYSDSSILYFGEDKWLLLFGFSSLTFLIMVAFIFVTMDNRKLIKEALKKDQKIEELLKFIIEQNDSNQHENLLAHHRTKEMFLDSESKVG